MCTSPAMTLAILLKELMISGTTGGPSNMFRVHPFPAKPAQGNFRRGTSRLERNDPVLLQPTCSLSPKKSRRISQSPPADGDTDPLQDGSRSYHSVEIFSAAVRNKKARSRNKAKSATCKGSSSRLLPRYSASMSPIGQLLAIFGVSLGPPFSSCLISETDT